MGSCQKEDAHLVLGARPSHEETDVERRRGSADTFAGV